jgi:hypothetical protein
MTAQNQPTLDKHMAMLGRIVARFVSTGLLPVNVGSREIEKFLGQSEDQKTFEAVVTWMLDEDIIRAKNVHVANDDGSISLIGAQLTSKALAIIKQPLPTGDTIKEKIQAADSGGGAQWSGIGELIGRFASGFAKGMGSG